MAKALHQKATAVSPKGVRLHRRSQRRELNASPGVLGLSSGFWPCPEHAVGPQCSLSDLWGPSALSLTTDILAQPPRWASPAHGCPPSSRPTAPHHGGGSRDRAAVRLAWPRPGTQPAEQPSDPAPVHGPHGRQPQLGGVLQKMLRMGLAMLLRL